MMKMKLHVRVIFSFMMIARIRNYIGHDDGFQGVLSIAMVPYLGLDTVSMMSGLYWIKVIPEVKL